MIRPVMRRTLPRSAFVFVLGTAFAAAVGAQVPGAPGTPPAPGTPAATERVLSVATLAPTGSTWMRGLNALNRELRRRTNNAVSLRIYAGGVQGDESEVIRKMRQGRLDGAVVTGIGLGQIHRPTLAFMLPGMFRNQSGLDRARAALVGEVSQQFRTAGFELAAWGESGSPRLFSQREIRTPTDLRQVHPWVWREDVILPQMFEEVGASSVRLGLPEVLGALQTHRIDTVIAPPVATVALQWSAHFTHMSEGANSFGVGGFVFSRQAWDSLPADQQAVTREVINQFQTLIGRNIARDDLAAISSMAGRGVTAVSYTDAERAQWTAMFTRMRARLVGVVSDAAWMDRVRTAGN